MDWNKGDDVMEFDVVEILTKYGIPTVICLVMIWRINPSINGLKEALNKLVITNTDLASIVKEDSRNTREMRQEISNLRVDIKGMNGKK